jgi:hypothetical protein
MTRETAMELLEVMQRYQSDPASVDPAKLAQAYIVVLGSLRE